MKVKIHTLKSRKPIHAEKILVFGAGKSFVDKDGLCLNEPYLCQVHYPGTNNPEMYNPNYFEIYIDGRGKLDYKSLYHKTYYILCEEIKQELKEDGRSNSNNQE